VANQTDADVERQIAERRLLTALRRFHRRDPLADGIRTDALVGQLREPSLRPASHRGAAPLRLSDAELRHLIDDLVRRGVVERQGHRLRLPGHRPEPADAALEAGGALLDELRSAGASPPRADSVARRLGIAPWIVDALRRSGELVELGPGIDYPRDVLDALIARLRAAGCETVAQARDELGTSRRYAAALMETMRDR
jgi:selenocysteine-specific elongation factor